MMQSEQIIASLINALKSGFYLFKRWWNQNKLLHHYFQTILNSFFKNDASKTNYCITIFKHFWTCLKYDAIKKIITSLINAFQTSFYPHRRWCNQNKLLHHYFKVLNMFELWCNQNKLLHHYFQTVLSIFEIWCNQCKLLHHYS